MLIGVCFRWFAVRPKLGTPTLELQALEVKESLVNETALEERLADLEDLMNTTIATIATLGRSPAAPADWAVCKGVDVMTSVFCARFSVPRTSLPQRRDVLLFIAPLARTPPPPPLLQGVRAERRPLRGLVSKLGLQIALFFEGVDGEVDPGVLADDSAAGDLSATINGPAQLSTYTRASRLGTRYLAAVDSRSVSTSSVRLDGATISFAASERFNMGAATSTLFIIYSVCDHHTHGSWLYGPGDAQQSARRVCVCVGGGTTP